jgi:hypothetical protein
MNHRIPAFAGGAPASVRATNPGCSRPGCHPKTSPEATPIKSFIARDPMRQCVRGGGARYGS